MIKIFKKEILDCKYNDFVKDEIVIDNICVAIPYDNKCDIFLANGIKITVTKEVYKRIIEQQCCSVEKNFEKKKDGFVKPFIKKIKGKE